MAAFFCLPKYQRNGRQSCDRFRFDDDKSTKQNITIFNACISTANTKLQLHIAHWMLQLNCMKWVAFKMKSPIRTIAINFNETKHYFNHFFFFSFKYSWYFFNIFNFRLPNSTQHLPIEFSIRIANAYTIHFVLSGFSFVVLVHPHINYVLLEQS